MNLPLEFNEYVSKMSDDSSFSNDGNYGFDLPKHSNFRRRLATWRLKLLTDHPQIVSEVWKEQALEVFDLLQMVIHLSSGAPGRGTEIGGYKLRNTTQGLRNIYFWKESVMILTHYNKSRTLRSGKNDVIARFTDAETGYLTKSWLLLVRPLVEIALRRAFKPTETAKQNDVYVFFDMGLYGSKTSSQINKTMRAQGFFSEHAAKNYSRLCATNAGSQGVQTDSSCACLRVWCGTAKVK